MNFFRQVRWYLHGKGEYTKQGYEAHAKKFKAGDIPDDLSDRRILITGANAGLGRSTTNALASRGAEVIMVCRNKERGMTARDEVVSETGNQRIHLFIADMSLLADVRGLDVALDRAGLDELDAVCCNAGVMLDDRDETKEGFDKTYATNLLASSYLLGTLMAPKLARRNGRIVLVSSGGGLTQKLDNYTPDLQFKKMKTWDGTMAYAKTKRAQIVLGEYWSQHAPDGEHKVSVASMHPGWAETPGVSKSMPKFQKQMEGKLRTIDQGADTIVWLSVVKRVEEGGFYLDREVVPKHLSMLCTSESEKSTQVLIDTLKRDAEKVTKESRIESILGGDAASGSDNSSY